MSNSTRVENRRRSAGTYHEAMTSCPDARRFEFEYPVALAQPKNSEIVVDFPSGGGYAERYIRAVAPEVTYCAVEHIPEYSTANQDIAFGTWDKLNFADHSVDIILCLAALHHVYPRREVFYDECARVLRPGGRLIIGDVAEGTNSARFLNEFVDEYSPEGHVAKFMKQDIDAPEIESSGFTMSHWEVKEFNWSYPDKQSAIDFCRGLFRIGDATDKQIWKGLDDYLGIEKTAAGIEMGWQLAFIRADYIY